MLSHEQKLRKKLRETCEQYSLPVPVLKMSSMVKKNGTFSYNYSRIFRSVYSPSEVLNESWNRTIKVSKHIFDHFGYKEAEETLMHEIAHYVDMVYNKHSYDIDSHGTSFKKLCVELGGTMNSDHATGVFSASVSSDFVATKIGYLYTCPCGKGKRRTVRKLSSKTLNNYSCNACRTKMSHFIVTKLG